MRAIYPAMGQMRSAAKRMALARAFALHTLRRDGKEITPLTIQREAISLLPMIGVDVPNTNNDLRNRAGDAPPST